MLSHCVACQHSPVCPDGHGEFLNLYYLSDFHAMLSLLISICLTGVVDVVKLYESVKTDLAIRPQGIATAFGSSRVPLKDLVTLTSALV